MRERFDGKDGKRRLVGVFAEQELVKHNDAIACRLADLAELEDVPKGKQIYVKGEPGKNFLFFVLGGSFELSVQNKCIAILKPGQAVGEFPILDPSLTYTLTVIAREQSVIARLPEQQFLDIAKDYPEIWKNMAKMLVIRLGETNEREIKNQATQRRTKPGVLTIGDLIRELTVSQLWATIVAIIGALAAVAIFAHKLGSGAWS